MFEFIYAITSVLFYGSVSTFSKYVIKKVGRRRAVVYVYIFLSSLLILSALLTSTPIQIPQKLIPLYLIEIIVGASAAIIHYKTLEKGPVAAISPITRTSTLLVVLSSIIFLGEQISLLQITGSALIVASAFVISENFNLKKERWLPYALTTVILRTIYFTLIKVFVEELGPLAATVILETGNAILISLYYIMKRKRLNAYKEVRYALIPAVFIMLGAYFYNLSVSYIGAGITSAISGTVPVVGAIMSYAVLKEKIEKHKYVAIIILALGMALLFLG